MNSVELIMNNWKCIQCWVERFIFLWIKIDLSQSFFISFLAFFFIIFFNHYVFLLCILNFSLRSTQIINRILILKTFLMLQLSFKFSSFYIAKKTYVAEFRRDPFGVGFNDGLRDIKRHFLLLSAVGDPGGYWWSSSALAL